MSIWVSDYLSLEQEKSQMIFLFFLLCFSQAADAVTPQELIRLATTRPWPGENYPVLPAIPTALREEIIHEINSSKQVRVSYEKLDAAHRRNTDWFDGIIGLEKEKAVWSLLACLVHPHDDVQGRALESLARLKDKRTVPFLLIYAEYMAVYEGGSENATLHGILHQAIARTLSEITGIKVIITDGQNPTKLKQGIRLWRKWESEQVVQ